MQIFMHELHILNDDGGGDDVDDVDGDGES